MCQRLFPRHFPRIHDGKSMDLLPKLIFWESQMIPSYSFNLQMKRRVLLHFAHLLHIFCTSFAHLLHIFCTSFAHLLHAHLRTTAQCGFSTAYRIFHSIFRSKSSSVRDWLSAKRMAKTQRPFALHIYGFAISGQKMCCGEAQTPWFVGTCGSLNPISHTTQNEFPTFPSSKTDPSWVFKIFQPQQWLVMMASQVRFLICTDVAARGIDIAGLPFVIQCLGFVVTKG